MLLIDVLLVFGLKVDCDIAARDATLVDFLALINSYVVFLEVFGLCQSELVLLLTLTWL